MRITFTTTDECRVEVQFPEPIEKFSMTVMEAQEFLRALKAVERRAYESMCEDGPKMGS